MVKSLPIQALALVTTVTLAACGDQEPASELPYAEVQAARDSGVDAYTAYVPTISGKEVVWEGRVVDARREVGDEFVEIGMLYVDMDGEGVEPGPDVKFEVKPSQLPQLTPGQPVAYQGVVRELQRDGSRVILFLQAKVIE